MSTDDLQNKKRTAKVASLMAGWGASDIQVSIFASVRETKKREFFERREEMYMRP